MVPVVVAPAAQPRASAMPETASASAGVALRLMQGSGICLSLEIAAGALPAVVRELSRLRC